MEGGWGRTGGGTGASVKGRRIPRLDSCQVVQLFASVKIAWRKLNQLHFVYTKVEKYFILLTCPVIQTGF